MENVILYVPQGTVCVVDNDEQAAVCPTLKQVTSNNIDLNSVNNEDERFVGVNEDTVKNVFAIFTDNLLSCSCFFIRDKSNRFCIFAHIDGMTNIIDSDRGLFATLSQKQRQYKIEDKDIEIYFEHGAPLLSHQQNLIFNYESCIRCYLTDKNKHYRLYEITDLFSNQINEYRADTEYAGFKLIYNSAHKDDAGNSNRRGVIYHISSNVFDYSCIGVRGEDSSIFNKILDNQKIYKFRVLPLEIQKIETKRLIYDEHNYAAEGCLYYDYLSNIRKTIKKKLENEHITKYTDTEIDLLFKADFIFPPIYVYRGKNVTNQKIVMDETEIKDNIAKYEKYVCDIINVLSATEIQNLLDNSALEKFLLVQFNEQYNGISRNNNFYYKQLDGEKKHLVDNITNITERMEQQLIREIQQLPPVTNKTTQQQPIAAKETQQQNTSPKATPTEEVVEGTEKLTTEVNKTNEGRIKEGVKSIKIYSKEEQYAPNTPQL